jgi:hypothetical protein
LSSQHVTSIKRLTKKQLENSLPEGSGNEKAQTGVVSLYFLISLIVFYIYLVQFLSILYYSYYYNYLTNR